jgi:hypothetical protein
MPSVGAVGGARGEVGEEAALPGSDGSGQLGELSDAGLLHLEVPPGQAGRYLFRPRREVPVPEVLMAVVVPARVPWSISA